MLQRMRLLVLVLGIAGGFALLSGEAGAWQEPAKKEPAKEPAKQDPAKKDAGKADPAKKEADKQDPEPEKKGRGQGKGQGGGGGGRFGVGKAEPKKDFGPGAPLPAEYVRPIQWRSVGPANMGGRITAIAVNPADFTNYWIATAGGGLLKTTNNGITFEHQFDQDFSDDR